MDHIGIEQIAFRSLLVFGTSIVVWVVASTVISWYRLRHIPGPWLASISNLWIIRAATSTRLSDAFGEAGKRFGPLVRIGPNYILTSDADFLRKTGAVRGTYNRSPWYTAFRCMAPKYPTINFLSHDAPSLTALETFLAQSTGHDRVRWLSQEHEVANERVAEALLRPSYVPNGLLVNLLTRDFTPRATVRRQRFQPARLCHPR